MPSNWNWKVDCNSVVKTCYEWRVGGGMLSLKNQAVDTLTFLAVGQKFDSAEKFQHGQTVKLLFQPESGDPVQWFYGRVTGVPRSATSRNEAMRYNISGPWWYLENIPYEQIYNVVSGYNVETHEFTFTQKTTSHLFMNQKLDGTKMNTAEQITDALEWAISRGAPIAIGGGFPAIEVPIDEARDMTVAEVIRKMCRWFPDAVVWFDYSTTLPTLYCKRYADLVDVDLTVGSGSYRIDEIQLDPRYDLKRPCVHLKFEQSTVIGESSRLDVYERFAPDPLPPVNERFGGLVHTIDLAGYQASVTKAPVETQTISLDDINWWKDNVAPELKDAGIATSTIVAGSVKSSADGGSVGRLPRRLTKGTIADWMKNGALAVQAQEELVQCLVNITQKNGRKDLNRPLTLTMTTTDASTGEYQNVQATQFAEPIPEGLQDALFAAVSALHYQGTAKIKELFVTGVAGLGNAVNIIGRVDRPEWATMRAMVQEVSFELDFGITNISFGPPQHLAVADMVTLLQVNRHRNIVSSYGMRPEGMSKGSGSDVTMGRNTPKANTTSGGGNTEVHVASAVVDPAHPDTVPGDKGQIITDAKNKTWQFKGHDITDATNGDGTATMALADLRISVTPASGPPRTIRAEVRFRLEKGCDEAGNTRYRVVFASDYIDLAPPV
jgi:hypothetical protein